MIDLLRFLLLLRLGAQKRVERNGCARWVGNNNKKSFLSYLYILYSSYSDKP
jgi:hypothetical protein